MVTSLMGYFQLKRCDLDLAPDWAKTKHNEINHKYGGYLPYAYHLRLVVSVAQKYISLVPEEDRELVIAACWLHDTLEDCHISYNDIKKTFGTDLAELVYALTNEKGRTRKDRANDAYYKGIRDTKYAVFIKLCDRFANALYSCMFGSSQFEMYKGEQSHFEKSLRGAQYSQMWSDLNNLFNTKTFGFEPLT